MPASSELALTDAEVARLTKPERESRVRALMAESFALLDEAIELHVTSQGKRLAGACVLYSGGNDSTTLAHLMRGRADYAIHANTTVGIERTRQFVRDTCAAWRLPLLEFKPPRLADQYRALVLDQGFPGPGHHFKMFQRLKERGLREARKALVKASHRERVVFIAGRRRQESARRANVPEFERTGSIVWVSPLVNWTKLDMNTYRIMAGDVPTNDVTALIHMSGECLCGAFAHQNELAEIEEWFADEVDVQMIRELEALIAERDDIPEHRKKWGWGGDPEVLRAIAKRKRKPKSGMLCQSCDTRMAANIAEAS